MCFQLGELFDEEERLMIEIKRVKKQIDEVKAALDLSFEEINQH